MAQELTENIKSKLQDERNSLINKDQNTRKWLTDMDQHEATLDDMVAAGLDKDYKDELEAIESWFRVLSDAERSAALYALFQQINQAQIKFFIFVLQQMSTKGSISSAAFTSERNSIATGGDRFSMATTMVSEPRDDAEKEMYSPISPSPLRHRNTDLMLRRPKSSLDQQATGHVEASQSQAAVVLSKPNNNYQSIYQELHGVKKVIKDIDQSLSDEMIHASEIRAHLDTQMLSLVHWETYALPVETEPASSTGADDKQEIDSICNILRDIYSRLEQLSESLTADASLDTKILFLQLECLSEGIKCLWDYAELLGTQENARISDKPAYRISQSLKRVEGQALERGTHHSASGRKLPLRDAETIRDAGDSDSSEDSSSSEEGSPILPIEFADTKETESAVKSSYADDETVLLEASASEPQPPQKLVAETSSSLVNANQAITELYANFNRSVKQWTDWSDTTDPETRVSHDPTTIFVLNCPQIHTISMVALENRLNKTLPSRPSLLDANIVCPKCLDTVVEERYTSKARLVTPLMEIGQALKTLQPTGPD